VSEGLFTLPLNPPSFPLSEEEIWRFTSQWIVSSCGVESRAPNIERAAILQYVDPAEISGDAGRLSTMRFYTWTLTVTTIVCLS
jgi:hypothetical protein